MTTKTMPFDASPVAIATGSPPIEFEETGQDRATEAFASVLQIAKRDRLEPRFLAAADTRALARMEVVVEGSVLLGGTDHHYDLTVNGLGVFQAGYSGPALSLRSIGGERRAARRPVVWSDTAEIMLLRSDMTPRQLFSDPNLAAADIGRGFMKALGGTVAIGAAAKADVAKIPARRRLQWFADAAAAFASIAAGAPVQITWRLPCRPDRETTGWAGGVALTGPGVARVEIEADGAANRGLAADAERMLTEIAAGLDVWGYELQLVGGHASRQAVTIESSCQANDASNDDQLTQLRTLLENAIGAHGGTASEAARYINPTAGRA